jgi:phage shock protein A
MADDRYGTQSRIARLERTVADLTAERQRHDDVVERLVREVRQLRARVAQLDDRDRWVDAFRADQRDPFDTLGKPAH